MNEYNKVRVAIYRLTVGYSIRFSLDGEGVIATTYGTSWAMTLKGAKARATRGVARRKRWQLRQHTVVTGWEVDYPVK